MFKKNESHSHGDRWLKTAPKDMHVPVDAGYTIEVDGQDSDVFNDDCPLCNFIPREAVPGQFRDLLCDCGCDSVSEMIGLRYTSDGWLPCCATCLLKPQSYFRDTPVRASGKAA